MDSLKSDRMEEGKGAAKKRNGYETKKKKGEESEGET